MKFDCKLQSWLFRFRFYGWDVYWDTMPWSLRFRPRDVSEFVNAIYSNLRISNRCTWRSSWMQARVRGGPGLSYSFMSFSCHHLRFQLSLGDTFRPANDKGKVLVNLCYHWHDYSSSSLPRLKHDIRDKESGKVKQRNARRWEIFFLSFSLQPPVK